MATRSIDWSAGFWLASCAGLAAVVAYQLFYSFPLAPTVTATPPPAARMLEPVAGPTEPSLPGDHAVHEITARPLFSAGREPYVAPVTISAKEPLPRLTSPRSRSSSPAPFCPGPTARRWRRCPATRPNGFGLAS